MSAQRRQLLRSAAGAGILSLAGLPFAAPAASVKPGRQAALLVVDVQNCFLPGGTLAVKEGDQVIPVINRLAAAFENVIVTHLHYDHCGNHDVFPRATYHLQDDEMAYATGRCMCHPVIRIPFEADDVVAMVRKVFAGRVRFHDGPWEMAPGITVHKIGGHSKGLQCIRVRTRRGHVVLAADASHLYAHINEGRVFPVTYNVGDVLEGYETIKRLADSSDHIIPGHDPEVASRYPAARDGLDTFAMRLDVPPAA